MTPAMTQQVSIVCNEASLRSEALQRWAPQVRENRGHMHRKVWEWCYIPEALDERGMLGPGRRGLGFAVGQEPLAALFASKGCTVLATDLEADAEAAQGWAATGQHAAGLAGLNDRGILGDQDFADRVSFRAVDMTAIPDDLRGGFDFTWSCCAMEHLGSLEAGRDFLLDQIKCLRPGGVAVHTTEFNTTSDDRTLDSGDTVLFRKRDIIAIGAAVAAAGHHIEPFSFDLGDGPADRHVDRPPYAHDIHLRIEVGGEFVTTSIGFIITAGQRQSRFSRLRRRAAGRS